MLSVTFDMETIVFPNTIKAYYLYFLPRRQAKLAIRPTAFTMFLFLFIPIMIVVMMIPVASPDCNKVLVEGQEYTVDTTP